MCLMCQGSHSPTSFLYGNMHQSLWVPWCHFLLYSTETTLTISVRLRHDFPIRDPHFQQQHIGNRPFRISDYLVIRGSMSQFSRGSVFSWLSFTSILCPLSPYNTTVTCRRLRKFPRWSCLASFPIRGSFRSRSCSFEVVRH